MLRTVRVSVGRTWRVASGDKTAVTDDMSGYTQRVKQVRDPGSTDPYGLPGRYHRGLWTRTFAGSYQDRTTKVLVGTLIPLSRHGVLSDLAGCRPGPRFDVMVLPFAITTLLHVELDAEVDETAVSAAAARLQDVLVQPHDGGQVRDGVSLGFAPRLTTEFQGASAAYEEAGRFVVTSALHDHQSGPPGDAGAIAVSLATRFSDVPDATRAQPLKSTGGALGVDDAGVGLTLPAALPRAGTRMGCLHSNLTTLLAWVEALAAVTQHPATESCRLFQQQSAMLLNHLYRRANFPGTGGVYRSRLPEAWLGHRRLAPAINALTPADLPPLPAG